MVVVSFYPELLYLVREVIIIVALPSEDLVFSVVLQLCVVLHPFELTLPTPTIVGDW